MFTVQIQARRALKYGKAFRETKLNTDKITHIHIHRRRVSGAEEITLPTSSSADPRQDKKRDRYKEGTHDEVEIYGLGYTLAKIILFPSPGGNLFIAKRRRRGATREQDIRIRYAVVHKRSNIYQ